MRLSERPLSRLALSFAEASATIARGEDRPTRRRPRSLGEKTARPDEPEIKVFVAKLFTRRPRKSIVRPNRPLE